MKVVTIGLETVGPIKRAKVTEAIDLLKRERQVSRRQTLTLQFADTAEKRRRWCGSGLPPQNGFYPTRLHGVISNHIPLRAMISCIGTAWRYAELDIDGILPDDTGNAFRETREFARELADRVLGKREESA